MVFNDIYLLVICFFITCITAIRVDWNTNQGPIVPPTPRTTVPPQLPYREPAPVWEDQSNDIPNPNPYIYVLPPPSRPRPATNNYLTASGNAASNTLNDDMTNSNNYNYGKLITPNEANAFNQNNDNTRTNIVASLAPQYIPNVGIKYTAVVNMLPPMPTQAQAQALTPTAASQSDNGYLVGVTSKIQGKFNAKTKKYKVYEKAKYVPLNYVRVYNYRYY